MSHRVLNQEIADSYSLYNADCIEVLKILPDDSIHHSVFSPPYSNLYCYSNSDRDLGNAGSDDEFKEHFGFVISELFRVIKPGRIVAGDRDWETE